MLPIGKIIQKERIAQSISQEVLCEGICTASYLSRIESGNSNPSDDVIERLMQRLGKHMSRYVNYKNERDFEIDNLKYDIRRYYTMGRYDLHQEALNKLILVADSSNNSLQQFILLHSSFFEKRKGANSSELLAILKGALSYTKHDINLLDLSKELLTQDEVVIINNIAINTKDVGDLEKGILILNELKEYLDKPRIDIEEKRRTYPIVICNLTKWLCNAQRYDECIAMCDQAIDYCIKYDSLGILPDAHFNKGFALYELGRIEEAIESITQSYYIYKACKRQENVKLLKEFIHDKFTINT